jgi:predicted aspartyl protease
MLITGEWFLFPDDIFRPVVRGEVLSSTGVWVPVPFLLDTGADRTVFSAAVLSELSLPVLNAEEPISGLGGVVDSVVLETKIQLLRETGMPVSFRGRFAAVTDLTTLDISVLGRDITDNLAVIVDRPQDVVFLLGQRHGYRVEPN